MVIVREYGGAADAQCAASEMDAAGLQIVCVQQVEKPPGRAGLECGWVVWAQGLLVGLESVEELDRAIEARIAEEAP